MTTSEKQPLFDRRPVDPASFAATMATPPGATVRNGLRDFARYAA
jgi:hypothetical protein